MVEMTRSTCELDNHHVRLINAETVESHALEFPPTTRLFSIEDRDGIGSPVLAFRTQNCHCCWFVCPQ